METKKLVIVGAGGMGREVLFMLLDINAINNAGYDILGFIDNEPDLRGKMINNVPVLGNDTWLFDFQDEINVVIAIGNPQMRRQAFEKFSHKKNILFPSIIASNVKYSDTVLMGKGCIICFSSILTVNITLGDFVLINLDCTVSHDVFVNDFATLYSSVNVSGNVSIGTESEIGTGTNIIQNKSIGDNVIIGAGSVIVKDIPSNCVAVWIPAKPIKHSPPHPPYNSSGICKNIVYLAWNPCGKDDVRMTTSRKKVLVYPCGTEIGLEIYRAVEYVTIF
jgi:sugar O-acyltransferase (sialic acid O-acetyltransferase NeuD family)